MMEVKLFRDEGILTIAPLDKLTTTDFEQISTLVNPYIEEEGHLNGVLIGAESFPGWKDFAGTLDCLRGGEQSKDKSGARAQSS